MSNNLKYTIKDNIDEMKFREYAREYLEVSDRFVRTASKEKRILQDGQSISMYKRISSGDVIELVIEREESQDVVPEDLGIEVVYEDADLLVVNKRANMVVHPTRNNQSGTLSNGVMYHFQKNDENCIVRLVSRLDRDTSGLIMIAKNQFAHMSLAKAMDEDKITKSYLALVSGKVSPLEVIIDLPIGRPSKESIQRVVMEDGQRSITHYKVIEEFENNTLVELTLETGRTHQIRVHLSHTGHPIVGDELYGGDCRLVNRQLLHAYKLVFPHPRTGEMMTLESGMPEDMRRVIEIIK